MNPNFIISARQPFLNPDGTVSAVWFRFLEALSQIVGNPQFSTQDVLIAAETSDVTVDGAARLAADDALLLSWINGDA